MQASWAPRPKLPKEQEQEQMLMYPQFVFILVTCFVKGANGMKAKFIGTPFVGPKKKVIWVPKTLVTNLQGPKQVWVPKKN